MKRNYETPDVSVVLFDNEDIVTTSGASTLSSLWNGNSSDNDLAWDFFNNND